MADISYLKILLLVQYGIVKNYAVYSIIEMYRPVLDTHVLMVLLVWMELRLFGNSINGYQTRRLY